MLRICSSSGGTSLPLLPPLPSPCPLPPYLRLLGTMPRMSSSSCPPSLPLSPPPPPYLRLLGMMPRMSSSSCPPSLPLPPPPLPTVAGDDAQDVLLLLPPFPPPAPSSPYLRLLGMMPRMSSSSGGTSLRACHHSSSLAFVTCSMSPKLKASPWLGRPLSADGL